MIPRSAYLGASGCQRGRTKALCVEEQQRGLVSAELVLLSFFKWRAAEQCTERYCDQYASSPAFIEWVKQDGHFFPVAVYKVALSARASHRAGTFASFVCRPARPIALSHINKPVLSFRFIRQSQSRIALLLDMALLLFGAKPDSVWSA